MQLAVRFITVPMLVLSLGLQWTVLQTVAWTGMLISRTSKGSFSEAVSTTFDGQHPCCLCKVVKDGRDAERKQEQTKPGSKLDPALVWEPLVLDFSCVMERAAPLQTAGSTRTDEPPKPRPRASSPASPA